MDPKSILVLIFLILGLGIVILNIWNLKGLKQLSKQRSFKNEQLNDSKYFELKYKHEFLVATFSIVIAVIVFVGYDSYKSIKETLKKDVEEQVSATTKKIEIQKEQLNVQKVLTDSLGEKISINSQKVKDFRDVVNVLELQQNQLKNKIKSSRESINDYETSINDLKVKILELKNKNVIKQELYIVKDLTYRGLNQSWDYQKIYFKDLKTISKEPLPNFKEPPILTPFTNSGLVLTIKNVTTTSFEIVVSNNTIPGELPDSILYSLWISVIESSQ